MAELLADFVKKKFIQKPYLIGRGVLPRGGKLFLGGSPKTNKSYLMLNIMLDLARGRPLFGAHYENGKPVLPVSESCRVLYLEMELGDQGLQERFNGMEDRPGLLHEIVPEGLPLYIQSRDTAMRLDTADGRQYIESILKEVKPDVTVMDPFAKFNLSNENDAQEMGAVLRVADHFIEDYGTAIIFIHHTGKPNEDNPRRGGDRLRGSSALYGDLDTLIELTRKSHERTAEPILEMSFELRRGEPLENLFVKRHRDGTVTWLGSGFAFNDPYNEKYPKSRYKGL